MGEEEFRTANGDVVTRIPTLVNFVGSLDYSPGDDCVYQAAGSRRIAGGSRGIAWRVTDCSLNLYARVCSKPSLSGVTPPSTTPHPTLGPLPTVAVCPSGWVAMGGDRCIKRF